MLPIEEGATLKLYNWDQYIYKKVVDDFQKKYDVNVEVSTFNNVDEALSKIRTGQVDFDVFFSDIDVLNKMTQSQLLQPLNDYYLPNITNLWPEYTDPDKPFYDVGHVYSLPYTVYSTGIGWRNDLVAEKDDPWHISNPYDIYWNAKFKGKVGIYDEAREAIAMALLRNGGTDINTGNVSDLTAAKEGLMQLVDDVNVAITYNGAYEDLPKGIFDFHQAWSGDMIAAPWYGKGNFKETAPLLSYWWPKNGKGILGTDVLTILKSSKNPVLAHTFINYMMDFDVAMKNMGWNGYQPPQNDAQPEAFLDPAFRWNWIVPPSLVNCIVQHQDMQTGYWYHELPPDVDKLWRDIWEEVQAGI
ncbi:MAG: spermidine/putrescine ABC transporter substrate-binding protein [Actinobacteria bacterium]|nr:spermidine/putrescine ABC transporter substrate-binding protein [Actinomycetota bacterium]